MYVYIYIYIYIYRYTIIVILVFIREPRRPRAAGGVREGLKSQNHYLFSQFQFEVADLHNFNLRVSNPRTTVYFHAEMPVENSNLPL